VIWQKADSPRNSARQFSSDHDYMLIYSKAPEWIPTKLARTEEANSIYSNPDDDDRGPWLPGDPYANKPYSKGLYTIAGPTGRTFQPPPGRFWRISEERLRELDATVESGGDPQVMRGQASSATCPRWATSCRARSGRRTPSAATEHPKNEMRALFPDAASFTTPKPEALLKRVLDIATNPGDLVLDSFLGSGTTAAVAHKMGRRWIGIEMGEHAATHCLPRLLKGDRRRAGGISRRSLGPGNELASRTAAAFALLRWARRCSTPTAPSTPRCASPRWPPSSGSRKPAPPAPRRLQGARARHWLGIHYGFDSCQRLPDRREGRFHLKSTPGPVFRPARARAGRTLVAGATSARRPRAPSRRSTCCSTASWATSARPAATC
jgi:hypothetical protein